MSDDLLFLKLGGSLITDKSAVEVVRMELIRRIANEIQEARENRPNLRLLIGHGGGSFGHTVAAKYDTQKGVHTERQWYGFAQVADAMGRLNAIVVRELTGVGIPAFPFSPLSIAACANGRIYSMQTDPMKIALSTGAVPIVYGDAVFDDVLGGTIVSTESVLSYLARELKPSWILLAGEASGVLDESGLPIEKLDSTNIDEHKHLLGGSGVTDVTGGMESKVFDMISLIQDVPQLAVRIFSGLQKDSVRRTIEDPHRSIGTLIAN